MAPFQGRQYRGRGRPNNGSRGHGSGRRGGFSGGRGQGHENGHAADRLPLSEEQTAFIAWRQDIPYSGQRGPLFHSRLTPKRLEAFMQNAQRFVELRDDALRQEVITILSSEGGLVRIAELVGTNLMNLQHEAQSDFLEGAVLPFFRTVTHHDVLSSLLLERSVGDIFVFMFVVGGRRGVTSFVSKASILKHLLDHNPSTSIRPAASTMLTALLKIIECNQTASFMTEFYPVVDSLQACLDYQPETFKGTLLEQATSRDMMTIRRHFQYGQSIEPLEVAVSCNQRTAFSFKLSQDGPGSLSTLGRRHDNDHEAISDIKILPTAEEIRSPRSEYLPSHESSSWHIRGIRGLIDQQFRLLREDTVGQLRDCVHHTMKNLADNHSKPEHEKPRSDGLKVFTYPRTELSDAFFEETQKQIVVVATFDQPQHLWNATGRVRESWWENNKRLHVDSLVSLVDSEGRALFFSVFARGGFNASSPTRTAQKDAREEEANRKSVPKLWSDPRKAFVTLRIVDMENPALASILGREWRSKPTQQHLVEFPGILLPSFQPTLKALQRMSHAPHIPFSDVLLPDSELDSRCLEWPAYATQPGFAFDLGPITQDAGHLYLSRDRDFDRAALKSRTSLDDAQCNALIGALSRNLALIQGPPGTGKSYVAIQAVKVLLECRLRAELNPIICV